MTRKESHSKDVDDDYIARLRDAKLQKVRLEDEFEDASERWRKEHRRLNEEIDQLDQSLQKAKSEARRLRSAEELGDSELQAQLNQEAVLRKEDEDAFGKERDEWLRARTELDKKVESLEGRLVEVLQESRSPVRTPEVDETKLKVEIEARTREAQAEARQELEEPKRSGGLKRVAFTSKSTASKKPDPQQMVAAAAPKSKNLKPRSRSSRANCKPPRSNGNVRGPRLPATSGTWKPHWSLQRHPH